MYPPHHLGGYELSCRDVVERWRVEGHDIRVLTTSMRVAGVADDPDESKNGIARDLEFYWRDHEIIRPALSKRFAMERLNQRLLRQTLRVFRPDVVSLWHMGAMSMGLITTIAEMEVPMVFVVCDHWLIYGPTVDPWMDAFRQRPVIGRIANAILRLPTSLPVLGTEIPFCFVSDWIREAADRRGLIRYSDATVVYSGIDTRDFPIVEKSTETWRWRLLVVGRQEERKGTHVAVRALKHLPDHATLDIVGPTDPSYVDRLRAIATEDGTDHRIRFEQVDRSMLAARYRDADVFLFPVIWDEPFGLVPVESMASGTPVVATGTGGSAEFLVDGLNCLLVAKDDPVALARAIERLAGDRALRGQLSAGGLATARELTIDKLAHTLERWHLAAAERYKGGRPADRALPLATLRGTGTEQPTTTGPVDPGG